MGVSFNKIYAKLGSDYKKPDATTVISKESYRSIVYPLPVNSMINVGPSVKTKLGAIGVETLGQLALTDAELLETTLGKVGPMLKTYASGQDKTPVAAFDAAPPPKSVGNGMTFKRDLVTAEDILTGVSHLATKVAQRLRREKLKCNTVQVMIKDTTFLSINRQQTLDAPTDETAEIIKMAVEIIERNWIKGKPIRALTLTAASLLNKDATKQLNMFRGEEQDIYSARNKSIDTAIDTLRDKYGNSSISIASLIQNDIGVHLDE